MKKEKMAVEILMPRLTDTMLEGTISYWYCQEGDTINEGETLFVVETDKASVEVEASASGFVLKILAKEGEPVPVGSRVAIIGNQGENIDAMLESGSAEPEKRDTKTEVNLYQPVNVYKKIQASPAAKKQAKKQNIDLSQITGTGKNGLITKKDIELYLKSRDKQIPQTIILEEDERVILKGIPKAMAEKMALTVNIPQVTTAAEVDATLLKQLSKQSGITITSFVIWAVTQGLKLYPIINSLLDNDVVIIKKRYNIGVSVATPNGLVVPNIKNVEKKDIYTITENLSELVKRGRENRLTLDDIANGSFSITNSGVFGSLFFTPRINPPESAILGLGKIMEQPVVVDGHIAIRSMMILSLSYDHRVIDGENAVKYLQEIKKALELPGAAFK